MFKRRGVKPNCLSGWWLSGRWLSGAVVRLVVSCVTLGVLMASAQAITPETYQRSWRPSIELAGQGNAAVAITRLRELTELQRVMMHNTDYHPQTQGFVDGLWASLERFDLRRFYLLLPEQQGDWRQLQVFGRRQGDGYRVGPTNLAASAAQDSTTEDFRVTEVAQLGEMAALVRARQISQDGNTHYLLDGNFQFGLGVLSWPSVMAASQETFRIIVNRDPAFKKLAQTSDAFRYRARAHAMNSALSEADVDIIAPLWASFPDMWDLLAKLGKVESVVLASPAKQFYKNLHASFVINPDMMRSLYPDLARHLTRMNTLLQVELDLKDERGSLLRLEIDSATLRARLSTAVLDGQLVPIKNGKAVLGTTAFEDGAPRRFVADVQTRMNILGIVTNLHNMKTLIDYQLTEQGAQIVSRIVDVPQVSVEGRALGLMPTGLINVFLPKRIDELMVEFLQVACRGNAGRGIEARMEFVQPAPGEPAFVRLSSAFEGLDNFLVRIGMAIVSDRVIPDNKVSEDVRRLVFDTQEAFSRDLDKFAQVAAR